MVTERPAVNDDDTPDLTDDEEDQMLVEWFEGLHVNPTEPSYPWDEANRDD